MVPNIVIAAVGLVFLTLFLIEKTRKYSVKATLLKATTSILFIALGVVSSYLKPEGGLFSALAILGLAFGMLGDVWLDFKYVFKNEDKIFTYAGFVSFAIGHIFYITGMFLRFWQEGASVLYIILPFVAGALLGLVTVLMEKPLKLKFGSMKAITLIYSFFLFSMVSVAVSLSILHEFRVLTLILMAVGGALFAISDLILSGTYFGEGKERPVDIITNGVTYYLAQYVIAFSLYFVGTIL